MIDLEDRFNFTNKLRHPTNERKVVYRFYQRDQAEYFTELLVDADIDFEAQVDEEDKRQPTYFGVAKHLERQVDKLNFIAMGRNREKFIASSPVRWIIMAISLVALLLAVAGALFTD